MTTNEIELIEPMKAAELSAAQLGCISIRSEFRLVRHQGRILAIIPSNKITLQELRLFTNPRLSPYALVCDALEGNNLQMFFLAAIGAGADTVKLKDMQGE